MVLVLDSVLKECDPIYANIMEEYIAEVFLEIYKHCRFNREYSSTLRIIYKKWEWIRIFSKKAIRDIAEEIKSKLDEVFCIFLDYYFEFKDINLSLTEEEKQKLEERLYTKIERLIIPKSEEEPIKSPVIELMEQSIFYFKS